MKNRLTLPDHINVIKYIFYFIPILGTVLMYIYLANKNEDKMKGLLVTSFYASISILISAIIIATLFIAFPDTHSVESLNGTHLLIYLMIIHCSNILSLELLIMNNKINN